MQLNYNTTAIIQARVDSTRLPRKILLDLAGKTVLERVIERVQKSKYIDGIIVATTSLSQDLEIVQLCERIKISVYQGSETDVLDRFYQAAKKYGVKNIVRITSDCPLIDAHIIDQVILLYQKSKADYTANIMEETYPDGEDAEIFSYISLEYAWKHAKLSSEREHVTSFIRRNPQLFTLQNLSNKENLSSMRWTLDEKKDYKFLKRVFELLYKNKEYFDMDDILALLKKNSNLQKINANVIRNEGYLKSLRQDKLFQRKSVSKTQATYQKAKKIIPGGTQLLSKRPEMFAPDQWPAYYSRAKGCEVWDLDGNKYIDTSYMGIGTNSVGYADNDINRAVIEAVNKSSMTTLNAPEEYELAKLLIKIHPWAEMVRYARTGGEAMSIAVRLVRAYTMKDKILFCGYHGWHDWYLAANLADDKALDGHLLPGLSPLGVPRCLLKTAIPFTYDNLDEFKEKFMKYKSELAAVVMEPIRNTYPKIGFLETIRSFTQKNKIPLVFDEITAGFRLCVGGSHLKLGVFPDIAVLGKGMSNGYPMAAVIGKKPIMQMAQETFISSTYYTDRIGPTAALATINKMLSHKIIEHLNRIGSLVQIGWDKLAKKNGLKVHVSGIAPLAHLEFDYPNAQSIKTLMIQEMLARGYLTSTGFYASFAHKQKHIKAFLKELDQVFSIIKQGVDTQTVENRLRGPIAYSGFKRLI